MEVDALSTGSLRYEHLPNQVQRFIRRRGGKNLREEEKV